MDEASVRMKIKELNRLMMPLNFPKNRFKLGLSNNNETWTLFENSQPLETFESYQKAENAWAKKCRSIVKDSLS